MPRGSVTPKRLLALAVLACVISALLPSRFTRPLTGLADPVQLLFAPISFPASEVSRTLRPSRQPDLGLDPQDLDRLIDERNTYQQRWLQSQGQIAELRAQLRDLQEGRALAPAVEFTDLSAPVIGATPALQDGILTIRAGSADGVVVRDTIAVARGVHLVGRVVRVGRRTSSAQTITAMHRGRTQEWIDGLVFVGPEGPAFACQLQAIGDDRLEGDLASDATGVEVGQVVRLNDPQWPEWAQMLIVGRIESIRPKEGAPGRELITVRPELELERLRHIVLRMPDETSVSGGSP